MASDIYYIYRLSWESCLKLNVFQSPVYLQLTQNIGLILTHCWAHVCNVGTPLTIKRGRLLLI